MKATLIEMQSFMSIVLTQKRSPDTITVYNQIILAEIGIFQKSVNYSNLSIQNDMIYSDQHVYD